jgi:superfamily II DNA or RNA helicase
MHIKTERQNTIMNEMATYLGPKGYTILKEYLEIDEINLIRKELTVKPFVPKSSPASPPACAVYRESKRKMYLPKFYGLENYGKPEASITPNGVNINIPFEGDLRDYQKPIVKKWLKAAKNKGGGLIEADCGAGKTCMAIWLIAQLKKKTLIIVHKDFLLRQWKERLEQFMPAAKIGRIQGPIIDVEGKDVVIGMLQSLSMKDYDQTLFLDFGFTIIDEVHHISAEVFSRVLFKAVTKYMLGLSATMNRQDGLSKVFKMFIGNVEACWKRGPQENVKVKAINYVNDDPDFSRNLRNYRGQPDYVKMISKICEYTPRTEFILSVVQDIWTKNNNQQIMIIGHRKKQLTYIHDAIKHRGFATVGYYIGGMKEKDLKITEGENIVVATYKMAEEALDIKSLTTIVMSTPKKDVRQAVGRILRKGGEKLVIDFIDQHDIFKRHWDKRRRWYNTQKFTISMTDVEGYTDDNWELVPSRKKSTKMTKVNTEPYSSLLNGKCLL